MVREKLCEILKEMEYFSGGGRVFESDEVIDELIKFIGWLSLECANGVCGDDCPIHINKPNIKTLTPKQLEIYKDILTTNDNKLYGRGVGVTTVILKICEDLGLWYDIVDKYIGDEKMIRIIRDLRKDTVKESNSTHLN